MKKRMFLFYSIFLLFSCNKKGNDETNTLGYINHKNKLEILFIDDKFGEWGGNKKEITVYRDDFEGALLADYNQWDRDSPDPSKEKKTKSIKRIQITKSQKNLIAKCVNELSLEKINRKHILSNSGTYSRIMLNDSSLIISVSSLGKWKNFELLANQLKINNK